MPRFTLRRMMIAVAVTGLLAAWGVHARWVMNADGDVPWADDFTHVVVIEAFAVVWLLGVGYMVSTIVSQSE